MAAKISIEGTFTDKPVIYIDGFPVKYNAFSAGYMPEENYTWKSEDGVEHTKKYDASAFFSFSLTEKIGQLEANVSYRVKANSDGGLILEEKVAGACDECKPGKPCAEHKPKETDKRADKSKPSIKADFNSYKFIKNFHDDVAGAFIKNVK